MVKPDARSRSRASRSRSARRAHLDVDELLGLGVEVDLHRAVGRVEQVDGLVGQLAAGDVAVRELHRPRRWPRRGSRRCAPSRRSSRSPRSMTTGVLLRGLVDLDGLEAARERGVLLEVLLVLGPRRGRDRAQLAARQRRLEQVGRVAAALPAPPAPMSVCASSMNSTIGRGRGLHLVDHVLQPVLELALHAGAGLQQRRGRASSSTFLSSSGTSPATIASARPSTSAVLPTPGSPTMIGLFLRRRARMSISWRISRGGRRPGRSCDGRPCTGRGFAPARPCRP
jgi:hypothetical protein